MKDDLLSLKEDISINKKFSLKKESLISSSNFIDSSPLLKSIEAPKKIRNKEVKKFYEIITKESPDYDFAYMHKNLRTLKIYPIHIISPKFKGRKVAAYYDCSKNIIRYRKELKNEVILHELLHMASTIKKNQNNSIFSGFSQLTQLTNYALIGRGLNEGYTKLLTERYFDTNHKSYTLELLIATKLEDVIGKNKMSKMYFTADLKGLIEELLKYNDENSIINFIYAIDVLGTLYFHTDIEQDFSYIRKTYFYVLMFLLEIKTNKIIATEKNLVFAKQELRDYSKDFKYKICNKSKDVFLLHKYQLNNLIKIYMDKLEKYYSFNEMNIQKHI